MTSYGLMLEQGRGTTKDMAKVVDKDRKKAKYWCEKSAEQGHQVAINKLQEFDTHG